MPLLALLFLVGVWWAVTEAAKNTGRNHSAARRAARSGATARGASPGTAARQASGAFWTREALHGFPSFRHGWARGWHQHRRAMRQRDRERVEMGTERHEDEAGWREALLDHDRRRRAAAERGYEDDKDDRGDDGGTETAADDPPRDNGSGPEPKGRHRGRGPGGRPETEDGKNGKQEGTPDVSSNGNSGSADLTLDELIAKCEQLKQAADQSVNDEAVKEAKLLGDQVAASFPNDRTIQGHALDVASAAEAAEKAYNELTDAAQALLDDAESYRGVQEGVQASTGDDVPAEGVVVG